MSYVGVAFAIISNDITSTIITDKLAHNWHNLWLTIITVVRLGLRARWRSTREVAQYTIGFGLVPGALSPDIGSVHNIFGLVPESSVSRNTSPRMGGVIVNLSVLK